MEELKKHYKRDENIVFRKIHDETILVPIKDDVGDMGFIYNLNEVGAFVWEHLDGEKSLGDIKAMIVGEFDVSPEEAGADLCDFVGHLKEIHAVWEQTGGIRPEGR
jgi:hypothetical protein